MRLAPFSVVVPVVAALLWGGVAPLHAEIIDRILAVVNGAVITLSDVTAAARFGIVQTAPGAAEPVRGVLDALVDRQLQLAEVNRYLPPEPADAAIQARLDEIRSSFPDARAFEAALEQSGLTLDQLRRAVRDNLRIIRYREQRFGAAMEPPEEDILRYYRTHAADFTAGGVVRPYAEVRTEARARLIEERTSALVREWVDGLRRRADITILPSIARG